MQAEPRPAILPTPLPRFLQIEPVGQCNLRCRMCPIQFRSDGTPDHPAAFMDFEVFCRLLDEFPALDELHLQGLGEPFMHPRFFDMVRRARARGIRVSTNSNLTLFSESRAEACVTSGLDALYVSIDAAEPAAYEFIRVRAKFDRVVRNLGRLMDARARLASATPEVTIVAVAMRRNLRELPGLVRLAHAHGVRALSVQHLCHDFGEESLPAQYRPMREFVEEETLLHESLEAIEAAFAEARAVAEALGVQLRLPRVRPKPHAPGLDGRSRCDWPWRGAYVSYAGEAMPCCMVATPDRINFGNMAREGVAPIWNGAGYEAFRARLASDDPPAVCKSCAVYHGTF